MRTRHLRSAALVLALVSGALIVGGMTYLSAATQVSKRAIPPDETGATPDDWDTFSADITVRHSRVQADGTPFDAAASPTQYHWERSRTANGWKTTVTTSTAARVTLNASDGAVIQDNRFSVARIEDDEDGSPVRLYNQRGEQVPVPPPVRSAAPRSDAKGLPEFRRPSLRTGDAPQRPAVDGGRAWLEGIIASSSAKATRRQGLERQLGSPTSRVRGADRFVVTRGETTQEVLADPESAVPVEMNVVRSGRLVTHSTFGYVPGAGGSLVRHTIHTEQLASNKGDRLVTDIEYTNIRTERRGSR